MCGISGVIGLSGETTHAPVDSNLVQRMTQALHHRGPDADGYYFNKGIGLGSRRLSIIDLAGGDQPIHNEDQTVWVVFNGEIYNYQSLFHTLTQKNHHFYTKTDTETIVHLYEEFGDDFVQHLRGMFALALWDEKRRRLLLARDRVGIKPLFYRVDRGTLFFASEIKCLLLDSTFSRELHPKAFDQFLSLGYVPGPETIFRHIYQVPPGHLVICENSHVRLHNYWRLTFNPDTGRNLAYFRDRTLELLQEAVKLHLVSDVPVGAFLSGGIDSSTVVALMSEFKTDPVNTFTVGYTGAGRYLNELPKARSVAEKYRTNHREVIVDLGIAEILPDMIKTIDQPFADSSMVPSYYISKVASQHVKVALSGLGGDELFGGYERYAGLLLADYYRYLPAPVKDRLVPSLVHFVPELRNGHPLTGRLKRFLRAAPLPTDLRYFSYLSSFTDTEKLELLSPDLLPTLQDAPAEHLIRHHFNSPAATDSLHKAINVDLHTYLPDDILMLTDRLSMRHSLEVRVPFLDHVLLEFAATIPPSLKTNGLRKKYILIRSMQQRLPAAVLRGKKIGFASPFAEWFRGELKEFTADLLSEDRLRRRGYFNAPFVTQLLQDHFHARRNVQRQILALVAFEIWCDNYLDGSPAVRTRTA